MAYDPFQPRRRSAPHGARISFNFIALLALFAGSGAIAFLGYLPGSPLIFVFVMAGWFVSLCLHEYGHARVAYQGGDHTVAEKGYLSLDFLHYVDPFVSLVLPTLILIMGGFAFPGGAVYIQTNLLRSRGWQSAVSAAGPVANLICLILVIVPFWLGLPERAGAPGFWGGMAFLALLNVSATLFNLLPIPGFDGYGILRPWLPPQLRARLSGFEAGAIMLVLALFLFAPGVASWFFGIIFRATMALGVNVEWILIGRNAFYFWS